MEETKDNVQRPFKGMVSDCSPMDQPKDTYRYALNGINQSEGGTNSLSTEMSNKITASLPTGSVYCGNIPMQGNTFCILSTGTLSAIALFDGDSQLEIVVSNIDLHLDPLYPVSGVYRLRRNNERVVYWVDGNNKPRYFNFDRTYDFYSAAYKAWLESDKSTTAPPKWEEKTFNLLTSYDYSPEFVSAEIVEGGKILSGSYSAAIQLVDSNLHPTEWITVSNPVRVYIDSLDTNYPQIRGSRNSSTDAQNFSSTSKSIMWTLTKLDPRFTYYRIAILQANQQDGNIAKALVSPLTSIINTKFTYSGDDSSYTSTPIADIQVSPVDIASATSITQLENRLILAGIKGKQIDWCAFQSYASQIKANAEAIEIVLDEVTVKGNAKHPHDAMTGYMPDEVYSFGIVYVFNDGTKSPVFHIPGRPQGDDIYEEADLVAETGMDYYECTNNFYPPLHTCMDLELWGNTYWGEDGYENSIVNTPIRHHKFPKRTTALYETKNVDIITGYYIKCMIHMDFAAIDFEINTKYKAVIDFTVDGVPYNRSISVAAGGIAKPYGSWWAAQAASGLSCDFGYFPLGSVIVFGTVIWYIFTEDPEITDPAYTIEDTSNYNYAATEAGTKLVSTSYGIKFTNIIPPHQDIIGYEIVRNKRTEDDKLVIDNVIIGPLLNTPITDPTPAVNDYHSFGLLTPNTDAANLSLHGFFIFSPEHQFYTKKLTFDLIKVTGKYSVDGTPYVPTETFEEEFDPAKGPEELYRIFDANGLYLQDVKAGTTFNSEYNKGEDPDGFDLQVLYRSSKFTWSSMNSDITMPDFVHYLSACGYKTDTDGNIFFNASADNKIIIGSYTDANVGTYNPLSGLFAVDNAPVLYTASLQRANLTAYNNFINRTYYKEHENVLLFPDTGPAETPVIANGDSYVTPMTINSSTYYDTRLADFEKKSRVWKIIAGAILIIGGAILSVVSYGALSPLGIAAISYGVSLVTSGVSFEIMKNMIDDHYEAGLKICLEDDDNNDANYKSAWGYAAPTPPETDVDLYEIRDDKFLWFTDRIQDIYFESSVNTALRSGLTNPVSDFINSPSVDLTEISAQTYEAYLAGKFTVIDRERNSGRVYTGFPTAEFYDINLDYLRKNYEKSYYYLPAEYDCCTDHPETYDDRCHYSEQSFQEEKLDNYRVFLPNNYRDIEGEFGRITNIFRQGANLLIHTEEALFHLPQNLQERVNQELVSFIGTGEFFSIPPRKLSGYGSRHKFATAISPFGTLYVSSYDRKVFLLGEQAEEISKDGMYFWFKENLRMFLAEHIKATLGLEFEKTDNAISEYSTGIHSTYDHANRRFLITKIDYEPFVSYTDFDPDDPGLTDGDLVYNSNTQKFGTLLYVEVQPEEFVGTMEDVSFLNEAYFVNKSWTISYSLVLQSWTSFHSYLPSSYFSSPEQLYSLNREVNTIYQHNAKNGFLKFFGVKYPYIIEEVSLSHPFVERILNNVTIYAQVRRYNNTFTEYEPIRNRFFTRLVAYNSRQCSGEQILLIKQEDADFMLNQIQDDNEVILVENAEGKWMINDFRDLRKDMATPVFTSSWESQDFIDSFPVDKVVNADGINKTKDWMQLESFRDKYVILRLIFDNFADTDAVELVTNYSVENEQMSIR